MQRFRLATFFVAFALVFSLAQQTAAGDPIATNHVRPVELAKSKFVQDQRFVALKRAEAEWFARGAPLDPVLNTFTTQLVIEPEGGPDLDDNSPRNAYTDSNYWSFCTAGAVTATLWYWKPTNVTDWPAGYFIEPAYAPLRVTTYWKSTDTDGNSPYYVTWGRAYMMYIAEQVSPPSFTNPGEIYFSSSGPSGTLPDMRDALNWEASSHGSNWSYYFYVAQTAANLTQAALHNSVVTDISNWSVPLIAVTKTDYLPNWSRTGVIHAITIVGYDDVAGTYSYLDTCGQRCGSSGNGGLYTVSQSALYNGIQAAASSGSGIVW